MNTEANRMDQMQSDLATLAAQYVSMQRDLEEIKADLKVVLRDNSQRISALEVGHATCNEKWSGHATQHRTENRIVTVIATAISSAISGFIGWKT